MENNPVILISRTDSIGDVVLTLLMAGIIKQFLPQSKIIFLGRNYTKDVIDLCEHVDEFVSFDDDGSVTGVNYSKMSAVLIQGLKELKQIVDEQQIIINRLNNK